MNDQDIQQEKLDWLKKQYEAEAQRGKSFAPEFISSIADTVMSTLHDWLTKNKLPEEVIDLANYAVMIERISNALKHGELADGDAVYLTQELPRISETIARLGGEFVSKYLGAYPRENMITWQPPILQQDQK